MEKIDSTTRNAMKKATSNEPTAPKAKHVRVLTLSSFGCGIPTFYATAIEQLRGDKPVVHLKTLDTIHRVVRDGSPLMLGEYLKPLIQVLQNNIRAAWNSTRDPKGYILMCLEYAKFLVARFEFHHNNCFFTGKFEFPEKTEIPENYFTIVKCKRCVEDLLIIWELLLKIHMPLVGTTSRDLCKVDCMIPMILDCFSIYNLTVFFLENIAATDGGDAEVNLFFNRYLQQIEKTRVFYDNCRQIKYITDLIDIPVLPERIAKPTGSNAKGKRMKRNIVLTKEMVESSPVLPTRLDRTESRKLEKELPKPSRNGPSRSKKSSSKNEKADSLSLVASVPVKDVPTHIPSRNKQSTTKGTSSSHSRSHHKQTSVSRTTSESNAGNVVAASYTMSSTERLHETHTSTFSTNASFPEIHATAQDITNCTEAIVNLEQEILETTQEVTSTGSIPFNNSTVVINENSAMTQQEVVEKLQALLTTVNRMRSQNNDVKQEEVKCVEQARHFVEDDQSFLLHDSRTGNQLIENEQHTAAEVSTSNTQEVDGKKRILPNSENDGLDPLSINSYQMKIDAQSSPTARRTQQVNAGLRKGRNNSDLDEQIERETTEFNKELQQLEQINQKINEKANDLRQETTEQNAAQIQIMEQTSTTTDALTALLNSSRKAQIFRIEQGYEKGGNYREARTGKQDTMWNDGLLSAGKNVVYWTQELANQVMNNSEDEAKIQVILKQINSHASQLQTAALVSLGDNTELINELKESVARVRSTSKSLAEQVQHREIEAVKNEELSGVKSQKYMIEQQLKVFKLQQDLDSAQKQLMHLRKQQYQNQNVR